MNTYLTSNVIRSKRIWFSIIIIYLNQKSEVFRGSRLPHHPASYTLVENSHASILSDKMSLEMQSWSRKSALPNPFLNRAYICRHLNLIFGSLATFPEWKQGMFLFPSPCLYFILLYWKKSLLKLQKNLIFWKGLGSNMYYQPAIWILQRK
jgi:hypothetical protein